MLCLYTPIRSLAVIIVTAARHGAATMTALPLYFYSLPRPTSMTALPEIYRCPDITLHSFSCLYTFNIGWRVLFEYECRTLPLVIIFTPSSCVCATLFSAPLAHVGIVDCCVLHPLSRSIVFTVVGVSMLVILGLFDDRYTHFRDW